MKLLDILLDSPLYSIICEYLDINDINNIFIFNKKIFNNVINRKDTKKIITKKIWEGIDLKNYYNNIFGEFEYNLKYHQEKHEIITKKLQLQTKISKLFK
jgi:hypothetical protein